MVDPEALNIMEKIFDKINNTIPQSNKEHRDYARKIYRYLNKNGGQIECLEDPKVYSIDVAEIGTWSKDPWDKNYGLDSSDTRPIEYSNGLILDNAYAKIGTSGKTQDKSIERKGTIINTFYFKDEKFNLPDEVVEDNNHIHAEIVNYPGSEWSKSISNTVAMISRNLAESQHGKNQLDQIDGPLFVDGSIYPLGLIYWEGLSKSGIKSPSSNWKKPKEIIKNYINIIEGMKDKNLPVIGIVKTSSSKYLLKALNSKIEQNKNKKGNIPWETDHQFISEVLHNQNKSKLVYTSWLKHKKTRIERSSTSKKYEELEGFNLKHGTPKRYRRAFFYVRLPKNGVIFRVEAPYLMMEKIDREKIRYKALSEIAKNMDVPKSIKRADKLANISIENKDKLKSQIKRTDPLFNYNWDGRWKDLEKDLWRD